MSAVTGHSSRCRVSARSSPCPVRHGVRDVFLEASGPAPERLLDPVAELGDKAGLSRAAFAARFTALVGRPPLTYLTDWRMALAADLLRDTDATVAAVAREVGYSDVFAFSVAFKRVRGASPSAWRRA